MRDSVRALGIEHEGATGSRYVSISQGIVTHVPIPETSPQALLAAADEQLYEAKKGGRDRASMTEMT